MSEPSFLTVDQVERLHQRLIDRFGGSHGLRDRLLFEGAVLHPRNVYCYAQGDLFDVAAANGVRARITEQESLQSKAVAQAFLSAGRFPVLTIRVRRCRRQESK
jgi:hypothetical protein